MGIIKIGSFKNKVGITINPRYILFNNEKVKKIIYTTTEIWNHPADGLVPILTSDNGSDGGYAFASSTYEAGGYYPAFQAFENPTSAREWVGHSTARSGYIGYKFSKKRCVKRFTLRNRNEGSINSALRTIQLQGSNDGNTWYNIGEQLTNPQGINLETSFTVDNNDFYMYYRLYIYNTYGDVMCVEQLQFYDNFYDS